MPARNSLAATQDRSLAERLRSPWVLRLIALLLMAVTVVSLRLLPGGTINHTLVTACASALLLLAVYRLDYLHPSVAYTATWSMILLLSALPISEHARPLDSATYSMILAVVLTWLLGTVRSPVAGAERSEKPVAPPFDRNQVLGGRILLCIGVAVAVSVAETAYSGFLPLWSLITGGTDSNYQDFGIPSVHGLLQAFSNAVGCLSIYLYFQLRERRYLMCFLAIACLHLLFVTRGFLIILLVEAFVIRSLTARRLSRTAIACIAVVGLIAFSILGTFRSGDIKEIVGVVPEYDWVPTSAVWLYAYSYFSVLNLENMMQISDAPYFAGIMLRRLLPSVLRPESDIEVDFELPAMNVLSYIYPIYMDIGAIGVIAVTGLLGLATSAIYRAALRKRRFPEVASYACLLFCATFSFFIDFWFYLPVIFQIPFFFLLQRLVFARTSKAARSTAEVHRDESPASR